VSVWKGRGWDRKTIHVKPRSAYLSDRSERNGSAAFRQSRNTGFKYIPDFAKLIGGTASFMGRRAPNGGKYPTVIASV
jgi:hypothetical protein